MEFCMDKALKAFDATIEDMAASPVVMSSKKMKLVLKCLVYYPELFEILEKSRENFDYEITLENSLFEEGEDDLSFKMPESSKDKVALISNLLYEFDMEKKDFYLFLSKCFSHKNILHSYEDFCKFVLRPFKEAFMELYHGDNKEPEIEQIEEQEVEFVGEGLEIQTEHAMKSIMSDIQNSKLKTDQKNELRVQYEGLKSAFNRRDALLIKALWLGFEKELKHHKLCSKQIKEMQSLLQLYLTSK